MVADPPFRPGRQSRHEADHLPTHGHHPFRGDQEMTKYLLAGAAAFALMSGVAFAQSSISTQSTTTTNGAPVNEGYSVNKTQKAIDSNGNEINKSRAYESGAGG